MTLKSDNILKETPQQNIEIGEKIEAIMQKIDIWSTLINHKTQFFNCKKRV